MYHYQYHKHGLGITIMVLNEHFASAPPLELKESLGHIANCVISPLNYGGDSIAFFFWMLDLFGEKIK